MSCQKIRSPQDSWSHTTICYCQRHLWHPVFPCLPIPVSHHLLLGVCESFLFFSLHCCHPVLHISSQLDFCSLFIGFPTAVVSHWSILHLQLKGVYEWELHHASPLPKTNGFPLFPVANRAQHHLVPARFSEVTSYLSLFSSTFWLPFWSSLSLWNALWPLSPLGFCTYSFFCLGCLLFSSFPSSIYLTRILEIHSSKCYFLGEMPPEQPIPPPPLPLPTY